jgi:hypothetical protein
MKRLIFTAIISLATISTAFSQTQKDTIYASYTASPVVIDASPTEPCWDKATWHSIHQVWLGQPMQEGDFIGKFKACWDKDYLYLLVDVIDDKLSDKYPNPLDNYWNDDCVEIFVDENRSGGNHQYNNNAFAYHCNITHDVIDGAGANGAVINCRDNIIMKMDTISENRYLWEFAVKIFDDKFSYDNPAPSRIKLTPNKLMGFSIAYCDNDGGRERDNFIGSVEMPDGHKNDSYINCDYFGTMLLIDSEKKYSGK